ncbi:putative glycosyl transferase, family 31 [Helianthus annuus]|nr:putative glycosyl transferase, family 31 [Helianthus annuus]
MLTLVILLYYFNIYGELMVLKTIGICKYAITKAQNVSSSYVMKCNDDTLTRVDTILKELNNVPHH